MTRNDLLKNHKIHYVRIIVSRLIFERNEVKCDIKAFANAAVRRKMMHAWENDDTSFTGSPFREIHVLNDMAWTIFSHQDRISKCSNMELNIISFKNKSSQNTPHIMNFMVLHKPFHAIGTLSLRIDIFKVYLPTMRKYRIQLVVTRLQCAQCKESHARHIDVPLTDFIAVTCYNNHVLKQLKIENNPRARYLLQDDDLKKDVTCSSKR